MAIVFQKRALPGFKNNVLKPEDSNKRGNQKYLIDRRNLAALHAPHLGCWTRLKPDCDVEMWMRNGEGSSSLDSSQDL